MELTRRASSFELVSVAAAEHICKQDCAGKPYRLTKFVKDNLLTTYVASNTWLLMIRDHCGSTWYDVRQALFARGLIHTVERFSSAADAIVHGQPVEDTLVREVLSHVNVDVRQLRSDACGYVPDKTAMQLEICRYLKRITLRGRTDVEAAALADFSETQERLGRLSQLGYGRRGQTLADIKAELAGYLPWSEIVQEMRSLREDPAARTFTVGASSDAGSTFARKLEFMSCTNPGYFRPIMGSWLVSPAPSKSTDSEYVDGGYLADCGLVEWPWEEIDSSFYRAHTVKVSTAPKSVKGPRIIAMEPVNLQSAQRYAKDILYRYFPEGMDLRDQTLNQEMAFEGSVNGSLATIDLSSASDYVTKRLVMELFPNEFLREIWWMVPTHYQIKGRVSPLYSFATMGNGLTFWVESICFYAIARHVCKDGRVTVYGDDIIVPSRDASEVIALLEDLNFKVNRAKSFISGHYRESCGVEYERGIPRHSTYYPRFPVSGEVTDHTCTLTDYTSIERESPADSTMRLVALEKRLTNWSLTAARFISAVVYDAHPGMTTSPVGSVCPDLWGLDTISGPPESAPVLRGNADDDEDGSVEISPTEAVANLDPSWVHRDTWYAPHLANTSSESPDAGLLSHYRYWRFLKYGPRPWQESDGWLPYNASFPDREEERAMAKVVVWGYRSK